jgi:hypothetical protein
MNSALAFPGSCVILPRARFNKEHGSMEIQPPLPRHPSLKDSGGHDYAYSQTEDWRGGLASFQPQRGCATKPQVARQRATWGECHDPKPTSTRLWPAALTTTTEHCFEVGNRVSAERRHISLPSKTAANLNQAVATQPQMAQNQKFAYELLGQRPSS